MSVGTTKITGKAGPIIDLAMYLAGDLCELKGPLKIEAPRWTYGPGINQVQVIYADTITLTDGGNKTLDLFASTAPNLLLDIFKQALTMTALKFLRIKNNSTDSTLLVGGGDAFDIGIFSAMTHVKKIPPGGDEILWNDPSVAGLAVGTNKNLKLEDDGSGEVGDKLIDIVAMGLD